MQPHQQVGYVIQVLDGGQSHTVDSNSTSADFHGSKHNILGECSSRPAHQITQRISQPSTTGDAEGCPSHPYSDTTVRHPSHSHSVPTGARRAWRKVLPGFLCCGCLITG